MSTWLRRTLTILFWPLIDTILTIFSNAVLLKFGVKTSILSTIILMTILNLGLFRLLSMEKEIQEWVGEKSQQLNFWKKKIKNMEYGKTLVILGVYTISGPAMAGVPLIWILGVKGKLAYTLIVIGSVLNSFVWVGGVYNLFWYLVKDIIATTKIIF